MSDIVTLDIDGHVARVELNRPDKHNALSLELLEALIAVGDRIGGNNAVRAVVLSGAGENFCAGIDTASFRELGAMFASGGAAPQAPSPANLFQRAAWVWREVPVPVVCAVTGVAFGGGLQIALGADIRYAAPAAKLSIMEVKWGLIPDMAISAAARHVMPQDRLRELAYTGRIVDAATALDYGLVTALHDDPLAAAEGLAAEIAGKSPDAIRSMKRLFNEAWEQPLAAALRLEAELQTGVMGGANQLEAINANIEGRAPKFAD